MVISKTPTEQEKLPRIRGRLPHNPPGVTSLPSTAQRANSSSCPKRVSSGPDLRHRRFAHHFRLRHGDPRLAGENVVGCSCSVLAPVFKPFQAPSRSGPGTFNGAPFHVRGVDANICLQKRAVRRYSIPCPGWLESGSLVCPV